MRSRRSFARTPYRSRLLALIALLFVALFAPSTPPNDPDLVIVFGAEACRLVAYDKHATGPLPTRPYHDQTVIPRANNGGRDINAQICHFPDGSGWFIAGEDTGQSLPAPIPAGWGIFQLQGQPGSFTANQIGKLTPTFQPQDFFQPENYGCGILPNGNVLTTDVGDQYPPLPGNGQLILWFPPFDRWSQGPPFDGSTGTVRYCKIDVAIETPGGIYVDGDDVYIASNRPSVDGGGEIDFTANGPGGVWRYDATTFPTSNDAAGGCGATDVTGAPLADPGTVFKELIIPANYALGVLTASAIARAPNGNLYVSSVFSGKIAEFDLSNPLSALGVAERFIVEPPPGETPPPPGGPSVPLFPTNGTPFGIGVDPDDGQVYYADLGIGTTPPGPVDDEGDVYRVPFDLLGNPLAPVKISDEPYDYADGIGVLERAMLIHPSPALVRTGRTKQFTVVGLGLLNTVTWSVEEGAAGGTITASGLYTAPATVPPGARAHVLATSVADSSVVGRAPVDIRQNAGQ